MRTRCRIYGSAIVVLLDYFEHFLQIISDSANCKIIIFYKLCLCILFFPSVSVNVYVPKDRVTNLHQGYGFVEFRSEEDADYVSVAFTLYQFPCSC